MKSNNMLYQSLENKFSTIIQEMKNKKGPLITELNENEINEYIIKNLAIKTQEKEEFGEVFTPPNLIKEMLGKLPQSVWKKKDYKWLDPANGIGNFPMIVYFKLMKELDSVPLSKRSEHIIKNMLYMVELNPKNAKISRKIFGKDANILCMSFLSEDYKKVNPIIKDEFGVEKFDVIMGNPPFNDSQENDGKKGGGNSLWPYFVKTSLETLKQNAYLVFVHPAGWRKPESENSKNKGLFKLMTHDNMMKYLEIHNTDDGNKVFNAGTRYDWYVIKKHKSNSNTIIKDELGVEYDINLKEWEFLPNYNINVIKPLLKTNDKSVDVIYSRNTFGTDKKWVSSEKTTEYKYKLVHSTPAKGVRYFYTSTRNPPVREPTKMFGVPKVIFGESGINEVVVDYNGYYGITQEAIGIKITNEREGKQIRSALLSKNFNDILKSLSFGNFRIDWRIFTMFKPDFYKHPMFTNKAKTYSKLKSKSNSPDNKTKKSNNAGKVINRKTIKKPKNKKKRRTIKRKFWF
jgi:hypothetical protein